MNVREQTVNAIRVLSAEAIQKANSGHPGLPLGSAPIGYTLFADFLKFNQKDQKWDDRDRFVLSAGHGSMLNYSLLYLFGYDISKEDLKNFRQLGYKTPGHPEYGHTPGVETTTGPLGQGIANAVGMALAEAHLAATFNRENFPVVDHYTYALCGDGCLEEGISYEACSRVRINWENSFSFTTTTISPSRAIPTAPLPRTYPLVSRRRAGRCSKWTTPTIWTRSNAP